MRYFESEIHKSVEHCKKVFICSTKKCDIVTGKEEEFPVGMGWQYENEFP